MAKSGPIGTTAHDSHTHNCGAFAPGRLPASSSHTTTRSTLLAWVDLADVLGPKAHTLSGTYYDRETHRLYALPDRAQELVCLAVSEDLKSFSPCDPIPLTGSPVRQWDGEALSRRGDEFYLVANEDLAEVERFDHAGAFRGRVAIPSIYGRHPASKGLESLTISPSGSVLLLSNEFALKGDPSTPGLGTTVRILRRDLATGADTVCPYRTEPFCGEFGVSELLALSDTELLVLEREYREGIGNSVRLFYVDLGRDPVDSGAVCGPDLVTVPTLSSSAAVLPKTLVLDLSTIDSPGARHPGRQQYPILDNYEALALGPRMDDGRQVVFVTSDDNHRGDQVARTLVLALTIPVRKSGS